MRIIILFLFLFINSSIGKCQLRLSAGLSFGFNYYNLKKDFGFDNSFSSSPNVGLSASVMFKTRLGFNLGYHHSQIKYKVLLPGADQKISFINSVREFPTSIEFVVWKDTKDRYSILYVKPERFFSVIFGSLNINKLIAFGTIKKQNNHFNKRIGIDEYVYYFNQRYSGKYFLEKPNGNEKIEFFKSPFIGVKYKFKDKNKFQFTLEAIYGFDTKVSNNDIIIRSKTDNRNYLSYLSSSLFLLRLNISVFFEK